MKQWALNSWQQVKDPAFLQSFITSIALLVVSLMINFYAGTYATEKQSNSVTDIILSNTPVFNLDNIFIYGTLIFWMFIIYLCLKVPRQAIFTLESIALFVLIRSLFITLTHLGPFPDQDISALTSSSIVNKFAFGGDLFFSGHTGMPFLMALIFWDHKYLRPIFIATSIFFGAVVLLAHLHYSIDVLSAFFITYTIFQIAKVFFKKDYETYFLP